jgi:hypothetical protein
MSLAACDDRCRQSTDLRRHDREAASCLAGPRRFDRRVERKQFGLARDLVDDADDVRRSCARTPRCATWIYRIRNDRPLRLATSRGPVAS